MVVMNLSCAATTGAAAPSPRTETKSRGEGAASPVRKATLNGAPAVVPTIPAYF